MIGSKRTTTTMQVVAMTTLAILVASSFSLGVLFGAAPVRVVAAAAPPTSMSLGIVATPPLAAINPFDGSSDFTLIGMMYDYMFSWNWPPLSPITDLMASGYSMNSNGSVYTVSLKPNLKWDNGSPLNATDLWYTMWMYNQTQTLPQTLTTLSIVNSTAINFTLSSPTPNFIVEGFVDTGFAVLPYQTFYPVANANISNLLSFQNLNNIVADGPYVMYNYTTNENPILLTANPNYWNGPPALKSVNYYYYSSETAYIDAFVSGQIQSISPGGAYSELTSIANLPGDTLVGPPYATPALTVSAMLNDWVYPTNLTAFRRGLAYGTNVTQINDELNGPFAGNTTANQDFLVSAYNEQIGFSNGTGPVGYSYNVTEARSLLGSIPGFKYSGSGDTGNLEYSSNGTQVSLVIKYRTTPEPYTPDVATLLQSQWDQLGISASTLSVAAGTLRSGANNPVGWQVIVAGVLGPQTDNGVTPGPGIVQDIGDYYVNINGTHTSWNSTFYSLIQTLQIETAASPSFNSTAMQAATLYTQGVPEIPLFNTYNWLGINNNYYWGSASNDSGIYYPQSTTGLAYFALALDAIGPSTTSSSSSSTTLPTTAVSSSSSLSSTVTPTTAISTTASSSTAILTTTTSSPTTTTTTTTSSSNNTLLYAGIAIVIIIIVIAAVVLSMRRRPPASPPPASPTTTT